MAWTDITDAETGDILTAEQLNALRDNAIAIALGLDNAPRVLQKKAFSFRATTPNNVNGGLYWEVEEIRADIMTWSPVYYYIHSFVRVSDNDDQINTINANQLLRVLPTTILDNLTPWIGEYFKIMIRREMDYQGFENSTEYDIGVNMWGFELANMA